MQEFVVMRRLASLGSTVAFAVALGAPLPAVAQADSAAADGVGVARLGLLQGTVSLQRGDSSESLAAALNAPVLGGDYVTTGEASRTEIEFDGSSQLRLGQAAQLRFTHLDTAQRTLQLAQGTLELRLLHDADGTSEIDTPSVAIKPQERGAYRVSVDAQGQTLVTVRSGEAEVDTPQGAQQLLPGTTLIAQGAASDPSIQTVAALERDDFDAFNADRDRLHLRALADAAFVNTDIGGIDDLNGNGRWVTDGSYGHVWVPASVGPDWAPYRDGRWVWEDGYGWTWVADEPWGWAPYHYGSWYHSPDYGWCWYPPQPRVYTPWRPALVAFLGFGAGAGFGLGFGGGERFENIGWVPLAPAEPYHPWWGNRYGENGYPTIVNNTTIVENTTIVNNVTNVSNMSNVNVYRNVQFNGVSSVTSQHFLQGNFRRNTAVAASELRRAQVFRSALPIVPTASNLRFTSAEGRPLVAVHPALMQRTFAGNTGVVRRTSFVDQRIALAHVTRVPITPLNFRDARTTPIVGPSNRTTVLRTPSAAALNAHPPQLRVRPIVPQAPALSAHGAPASDPWARFNQSRGIDPGRRQTSGATAIRREPRASALPEAALPNHMPAAGATIHPAPRANVPRQPNIDTVDRRAMGADRSAPTVLHPAAPLSDHRPAAALLRPQLPPAEHPAATAPPRTGEPSVPHNPPEHVKGEATHAAQPAHAERPPANLRRS